jgi:hypothetical protein
LSFLDLGDLLGLLVHAQSGSEGSGKLGSQELSSSGGVLVQVASQGSSLLLVQNCQVSGNVLSHSLYFGKFGCAT